MKRNGSRNNNKIKTMRRISVSKSMPSTYDGSTVSGFHFQLLRTKSAKEHPKLRLKWWKIFHPSHRDNSFRYTFLCLDLAVAQNVWFTSRAGIFCALANHAPWYRSGVMSAHDEQHKAKVANEIVNGIPGIAGQSKDLTRCKVFSRIVRFPTLVVFSS